MKKTDYKNLEIQKKEQKIKKKNRMMIKRD